eukprot:COSAG01_NODE_31437_length_597_cov_6.730924_1_plen_37_part_01
MHRTARVMWLPLATLPDRDDRSTRYSTGKPHPTSLGG